MEHDRLTDTHDWKALTRLTGGEAMVLERVRLRGSGIAIEGAFELPPLARLTAEDQVFVACFVQSHGSIKEMERLFGVSYPTIKARLSRIAAMLPQVAVETATSPATPDRGEVIRRLERGEIDVHAALEQLES